SLEARVRSVEGNPFNKVCNCRLLGFVLSNFIVGQQPCASPEEACRRLGNSPVAIRILDLAIHDVVDEPCWSKESEDRLSASTGHICVPCFLPVSRIIMIAFVF